MQNPYDSPGIFQPAGKVTENDMSAVFFVNRGEFSRGLSLSYRRLVIDMKVRDGSYQRLTIDGKVALLCYRRSGIVGYIRGLCSHRSTIDGKKDAYLTVDQKSMAR